MDRKEFLKDLARFFKQKGFIRKGTTHFYKILSPEISIVFGFYSTAYGGGYGYLECGYCFASINKMFPCPRFNDLDLNCGRITTSHGDTIVYEELDDEYICSIKQEIEEIINDLVIRSTYGRREMIDSFFSDGKYNWYILGDKTAKYFGLTRDNLKFHFVSED